MTTGFFIKSEEFRTAVKRTAKKPQNKGHKKA